MAGRIRGTTTIMSDARLVRLFSWLSPVFPTGSYAYSAGLEQAVADGTVASPADLRTWLEAILVHGSPWNDAVLLASASRAAHDEAELASLSRLAEALAGSVERYRETVGQGAAFLAAVRHWFEGDRLRSGLPLAVAVGAACGRAGVPLEDALAAWLNAVVSNQCQVAIRLSVVGQDGAARVLCELEPAVVAAVRRAAASSTADLGTFAFVAEIAAMNHETLQPRLFLS
jgi:urease accessory protein